MRFHYKCFCNIVKRCDFCNDKYKNLNKKESSDEKKEDKPKLKKLNDENKSHLHE